MLIHHAFSNLKGEGKQDPHLPLVHPLCEQGHCFTVTVKIWKEEKKVKVRGLLANSSLRLYETFTKCQSNHDF